jgi:thermitase
MRRALCTNQNGQVARVWALAGTAVVILTLTACSVGPVAMLPEAPLTSYLTADPAYVLAVGLKGGETMAEVAAQYGGVVLVWEPGDYALLGLDAAPAEGDPGYELNWEANAKEFTAGAQIAFNGASTVWAGGASTVWAGGASTVWAGGASTVWAGGTFTLLPANTDIWLQVGLEQAHSLATELGNGVKVAVIDTGVDLDHPALVEALAPANEWWDFVDNDREPQEVGVFGEGGYGHGTNVAGIIRQVAPRATILPIRVLGSDGLGNVSDLAAAIDWAVAMGADVINLSLGANKHSSTVDKALKRAAQEGVFVISSAGNDNLDEVSYPAREADKGNPDQAAHMLGVTSVNEQDVKSSFANYSKSKRLELSAPGENVFGPAPQNSMASWSGTSMAAPIAAGAIALALGEQSSVDSSLLAEYLKWTAYDIYGIAGNEPYRAKLQLGEGRLDIHSFMVEVLGG